MPVTRDENYPPEMAQLMLAFNRAADGYGTLTVVNAALQLLAAGIGYMARENGQPLENALAYADHVTGVMKMEIRENWQREPSPSDIQVKPC